MRRERMTARALHGGEPCAGSVNTMFMPDGYDEDTLVAEISVFGRIPRKEAARPGVWVNLVCDGGEACWCRDSQVSTSYRIRATWRRWWRNRLSWRPDR